MCLLFWQENDEVSDEENMKWRRWGSIFFSLISLWVDDDAAAVCVKEDTDGNQTTRSAVGQTWQRETSK